MRWIVRILYTIWHTGVCFVALLFVHRTAVRVAGLSMQNAMYSAGFVL